MTVRDLRGRAIERTYAARRLRNLIVEGLGVHVDPERLEDFIRTSWNELSLYSHAIHNHSARKAGHHVRPK